jgi:hypothetical protein
MDDLSVLTPELFDRAMDKFRATRAEYQKALGK